MLPKIVTQQYTRSFHSEGMGWTAPKAGWFQDRAQQLVPEILTMRPLLSKSPSAFTDFLKHKFVFLPSSKPLSAHPRCPQNKV